MLQHGFVKVSTLNIALLGRQPKFCKNPIFFSFSFFFGFILLILGILVLFDVFVECFRFTQENKVGVYLIETEFFGWAKNMLIFIQRENHRVKLILIN